MIIDSHVHVEYKEDGTRHTPKEYLEAMDRTGIDVSVILGVDQADMGYKRQWLASSNKKGEKASRHRQAEKEPIPNVINFEDEQVAKFCAANKKRFVGIASTHPDRNRPDLKVKRALTDLGLRGLKLYPHSGFFPNDKRLDCVYETCIRYDAPVFIHTGIKALRPQFIKYNNPIYVDEVATRFPDLKIVMLHGGYPWVKEFLAVIHSNPNVWADLTFLDYIEKTFMEDGLSHDVIKRLHKLIGSERMMWGSEGPFMNLPLYGTHGPDFIKKSQDFLVNRFTFLDRKDKENILGNTIANLLRIP
ncbi:MAG: amidohydrolase family protein [Nanoarchaeota archaeon]